MGCIKFNENTDHMNPKSSKIRLLQFYELLWIHVSDAICDLYKTLFIVQNIWQCWCWLQIQRVMAGTDMKRFWAKLRYICSHDYSEILFYDDGSCCSTNSKHHFVPKQYLKTISHSMLTKTIYERLDCLKKFLCFEIGALFHSPVKWVKKRSNFKINKFLLAIQSFLYCLCSKATNKLQINFSRRQVQPVNILTVFHYFTLYCIIWSMNNRVESWA